MEEKKKKKEKQVLHYLILIIFLKFLPFTGNLHNLILNIKIKEWEGYYPLF